MKKILENFRRILVSWATDGPNWRRQRAWDLVFIGLLVWTTVILIRPIWVGPMSPMTDFGGHVAMADVWARYDEVPLYRELYELRSGWIPNLLSARFVGWFYPLLDTLSAARLFVSLTMIATVLALMGTLKTFERSRWLIFLALPFLWNGSFYWGMINFLPTIPLFFAGMSLAHLAGRRGGWFWGTALALICILSFLAHGMGFVFVLGVSTFALFFSLRRPLHLLQFSAFLPSLTMWAIWRTHSSGTSGLPGQGLRATLRHSARWWTPDKALMETLRYALDATVSQADTVLAVVLALTWLVLLALNNRERFSNPATRRTPDADDLHIDDTTDNINITHQNHTHSDINDNYTEKTADFGHFAENKLVSAPNNWILIQFRRFQSSTIGKLLLRAYRQAQDNLLILVVVCLAIALLTFPAYILETNVKTRVVPFFVFSLILLPRLPRRNFLVPIAITTAIICGLWWGYFLQHEAHRFAAQEMEPLAELSEYIPRQSRVECLGTRPNPSPIFWYYPIDHSCPGLIQIRRDSFGGNGFAGTGFNPVAFKKGHGYVWLNGFNFSQPARLERWDYVVVRGDHRRPHSNIAERIATTTADVDHAPTWFLYRIIPPTEFGPQNPS